MADEIICTGKQEARGAGQPVLTRWRSGNAVVRATVLMIAPDHDARVDAAGALLTQGGQLAGLCRRPAGNPSASLPRLLGITTVPPPPPPTNHSGGPVGARHAKALETAMAVSRLAVPPIVLERLALADLWFLF